MNEGPAEGLRGNLAEPQWAVTPDGLAVTPDLECGSGTDIQAEAQGRISLSPGEDEVPHEVQVQGPISCYNVCVLLHNRAEERRELRLDVRIPAWLTEAGFDYFLKKPYLTCGVRTDGQAPDLDWRELPAGAQEDLGDVVRITLGLQPEERRMLSTVAHYPYSSCCDKLRRLAHAHSEAALVEIGESVQGRPILALEVGNEAGKRAVFTGTLQPGEPSAWAVLAMAEAALAGESWWLEEYRLCFVPQTNPDGILLGLCNVNALHELAAFGFGEGSAAEEAPREVRVLWEYLASRPPVVYVDFHFLRLPNHPMPKAYFLSPDIYRSRKRAGAAIELNDRLIEVSGGAPSLVVELGDELWQGIAIYQAAATLDAVSFLYQYTGPRTSYQGAQIRGPEVMRAGLEVCRDLL